MFMIFYSNFEFEFHFRAHGVTFSLNFQFFEIFQQIYRICWIFVNFCHLDIIETVIKLLLLFWTTNLFFLRKLMSACKKIAKRNFFVLEIDYVSDISSFLLEIWDHQLILRKTSILIAAADLFFLSFWY